MRQQCTPQSSLVTLGDVAEIFSADAAQADALKRIELFPAPASDQPRVLRVRELQDLLASRGVNLAEHRFSGSAQVQIASGKKRADPNQPLSEQAVKRAQRRVQEAVLKYLQEQSPTDQPRTLQFDLTAAQQRALANPLAADLRSRRQSALDRLAAVDVIGRDRRRPGEFLRSKFA